MGPLVWNGCKSVYKTPGSSGPQRNTKKILLLNAKLTNETKEEKQKGTKVDHSNI